MKLKQQSNQKGFTIIEVMIVLAIAGLILLIVFLAVPALQRNSRNTQYRNDAAALLASTQEFINNNNGALPAVSVSTTANSNAETVFKNAKLSSITTLNVVAGSATTITPANINTATLATGAKCSAAAGTGYTIAVSSARAVALIYGVEKNDGTIIAQCTES